MPEQPSLFSVTPGHDGGPARIEPLPPEGATPEANPPEAQSAASGDGASGDGLPSAAEVAPALPGLAREHQKPDAVRAMLAIQSGSLADRLLDLYTRAARGAVRDRRGRRWPDLTDYEAAAILGVERTSINAARNGLGGAVASRRKRRCRHRPSNQDVNAYALASVPPEA